jgi:hypothetical protein
MLFQYTAFDYRSSRAKTSVFGFSGCNQFYIEVLSRSVALDLKFILRCSIIAYK